MTLPNEEDGEEDEGDILLDEVDPVLRTPSIVRKLRTTTRCAFPYESTFCFLNLPIFQVALDQICESFQLDPLLQLQRLWFSHIPMQSMTASITGSKPRDMMIDDMYKVSMELKYPNFHSY